MPNYLVVPESQFPNLIGAFIDTQEPISVGDVIVSLGPDPYCKVVRKVFYPDFGAPTPFRLPESRIVLLVVPYVAQD